MTMVDFKTFSNVMNHLLQDLNIVRTWGEGGGVFHHLWGFLPITFEVMKLHTRNFVNLPELWSKIRQNYKFSKVAPGVTWFNHIWWVLGLSSKFLNFFLPSSGHYQSWFSQHLVFKTYVYSKLWRTNLFFFLGGGGWKGLAQTLPLGLRRVNST